MLSFPQKQIIKMQVSTDLKAPESLNDLFFLFYYHVDEWMKAYAPVVQRPGVVPKCSDSEVITIALVGQLYGKSELQWHKHVKGNYLSLFPRLPERSRFHRRVKNLYRVIEALMKDLGDFLIPEREALIVDSQPVPVCALPRQRRNQRWMIDFELPDAKMLYGRCVAQQSNYWGFKLHLAISLQGVVRRAYLSPASEHDLTAAIPLLSGTCPELILGDKGYIGLEKYLNSAENQVITPKRSNQIIQNTPAEKYLLRRFRKRVETVNALLSDCIDLKKHRAKSKWGLQTRIALKLLAFNALVLFNLYLGIPPLKITQLIH